MNPMDRIDHETFPGFDDWDDQKAFIHRWDDGSVFIGSASGCMLGLEADFRFINWHDVNDPESCRLLALAVRLVRVENPDIDRDVILALFGGAS